MNILTKIVAAVVLLGIATFAWTSMSSAQECNTPQMIADQATQVGVTQLEVGGEIVAFVGEDLEAAKDFLAQSRKGDRDAMIFDRLEVYTHMDDKLAIVILYLDGCSVAGFPEEKDFVIQVVEYVRKGV